MLAISVDHTGKISLKLGPFQEKLNRNALFIGARLNLFKTSGFELLPEVYKRRLFAT